METEQIGVCVCVSMHMHQRTSSATMSHICLAQVEKIIARLKVIIKYNIDDDEKNIELGVI